MAAALALGACGTWMGTRFLASAKSGNHPGHKQCVIEAGFSDLVETTLFDGGWPASPHRALRNSTLAVWEAAGSPRPGARPNEGRRVGAFPDGRPMSRYDVATPWDGIEGEWAASALCAGVSAALVRDVEPVGTILARIAAEAEAALSPALPR